MPYLYPPVAPTISGDYVTASRFLNSTPMWRPRSATSLCSGSWVCPC
jgi:hypothetical protein